MFAELNLGHIAVLLEVPEIETAHFKLTGEWEGSQMQVRSPLVFPLCTPNAEESHTCL